MLTSSFDYTLPKESIAKYPPTIRGETNLLVFDTKTLEKKIDKYFNLDKYFEQGDIIILNETKVVPARIKAHGEKVGKVELFVKENHHEFNKILCIFKGSLRLGDILIIDNSDIKVRIKNILGEGNCEIEFMNYIISSYLDLVALLEKVGHVPIPPYMKREDEEKDKERYQTEFSKNIGSVAAPTASLNFTKDLEKKMKDKGVEVEKMTLHCGFGTFKPIVSDEIEKHKMHSEYYEISKEVIERIKKVESSKKKVCAVGTTVTRSLEQYALNSQLSGEADIFLYPGVKFNYVNTLLTNFHAPRSTPLILLNAFVTYKLSSNRNIPIDDALIEEAKGIVKDMYKYSLDNGFKFLSYGDSCLIL